MNNSTLLNKMFRTALFVAITCFMSINSNGQCESSPLECQPQAAGHGSDPCNAKVYCSNSGAVETGLINCTTAADTDGCGVQANFSAPFTDATLFTSESVPADCYSEGGDNYSYVQWIKFTTPPHINTVKLQGVGQMDAWVVFHAGTVGDPTEIDNYQGNNDLCTNLSYIDGACSDMNQWKVWTNPDAVLADDTYNVYYIALFYDDLSNGSINFKVKECESIDVCEPQITCPPVSGCLTTQQGVIDWYNEVVSGACGQASMVDADPSIDEIGDCGPTLVTFTLVTPDGDPILYNGSVVSCTSYVTIDMTAPLFTFVPEDIDRDCDGLPSFGTPTVTDNCSLVGDILLTSQDSNDGDSCTGSYTRTWIAEDECGNTSTASQTINHNDTEAPSISAPAGGDIACDSDPLFGQPTASDNCGTVSVTSSDSQTGDACSGSYTRTWTAEDACGNTSTASQTFNYNDEQDPVFDFAHADGSIACDEQPTFATPSATDNCGTVAITEVDSSTGDACSGSYTRTYTAVDGCGNSAVTSQTFTYSDNEAPSINAPAGDEIACDADPVFGQPTTSDNCGSVTVTSSDSETGDACSGSYTRTWIAQDGCGNSASASQTFTYADTEAPSITCPADYTGECDENTSVSILGIATGTDNCGSVEITWSNVIEPGCGGSSTIFRTFVATDDCGNTASCVQTIVKLDTEAPSISAPTGGVIACDADPVFGQPTASDNCGVVTVTSSDSQTGDACSGSYTRTWVAQDGCGNSASASQTFTYTDTEAPSISAPAGDVIACDAGPVFGQPTYSDNCGTVTVTSSDSQTGDACIGSYTRTWVAQDGCGNSASASQTFTYSDTEAPSISAPAGGVIACDADPVFGQPTASDNCGVVTVTSSDSQTGDACIGSYTRTWVAQDGCGNSASASQTFTYSDTEAPSISAPAGGVIACDADPVFGQPTASDNCGVVTVTSSDSQTGDACAGSYTRTWVAQDGCGNSASASQTFTYSDTEEPSISAPAGGVIACDADPVFGQPTASDNCGVVTVTSSDSQTGDACSGSYTRTWVAQDGCGNSASASQTFTYSDNEGPMFLGLDAEITVECDDLPELSDIDTSDNCGEVSLSLLDTDTSEDCEDSLLRMYIATDDCGNTSTFEQVIHLYDATAPEFDNCPNDITYQCGESIPDAPILTATDNCEEDVTVSFFETDMSDPMSSICELETPGTDADGDLYWAITLPDLPIGISPNFIWDENGASMSISGDELLVTGTVVNVEDPSYSFFVHFAANARRDWTEWHNTLTIVNPFVQRLYKDDEGYAAAGGDLWTTWDYFEVDADNAYLLGQGELAGSYLSMSHAPSNYLFGVQVGEAANIKTPDFGMASWFFVEGTILCEPYSGQGDISSNADCDNPSTTCGYSIERQWISHDSEGNVAFCDQTITIEDTLAPELSCPEDLTVECDESTDPSNTGEATATDNCSEAIITFVDSPVSGSCPASFERAWTATDECDNTSVCIQTISIDDTVAPILTIGADADISCDDEIPAEESSVSDNCDLDVEVSVLTTTFPGNCPQESTIVRTYTATDDCDNSTVLTQTITISDNEAPVITPLEAFITVECDAIPAPSELEVIDNCGQVSIAVNDEGFSGGCQGAIVRTYTATDECGNSSHFTQVINVVDTTSPVLSVNPDAIVECGEEFDLAGASATDNCGEATIESDSSFVASCGNTGVWTITYTATDECNNTSEATQIITIVDTTAPSLEANLDAIVECGEDFDLAGAATSDICGAVSMTSDSVFTANCGNSGVWTITYTATDECGNTATDEQIITVVDTTPPSITCVPDTTVECWSNTSVAALGSATGVDDCGNVAITWYNDVVEGCGLSAVIYRNWTATDDCGNTATCVQTITQVDTTAPEFGDIEAFITVECDDIPEADVVEATDLCGNATVTVLDNQFSGGCQGAFERIYTATDECGNSATFTQIVNVVDNTAPVLSINPDAIVECGEDFDLAGASATDNCGEASVESDSSFVADCGNTGVWTISYTATDECGNSTIGSQTITIVDTTAPEFAQMPLELVAECDDIPAAAEGEAFDTCGSATVTMEETGFSGGCQGALIRTYTATDDCGNTATFIQVVNIIDTTPPTITAADDATIPCGDELPEPSASADDNCGDATWTVESDITETCGNTYVMVRTYTATDGCGNTATDTQTITIIDEVAPEFGAVEAFITVECDNIPEPADIPATDNCGSATVTVLDSQFSGGCQGAFERIYTATDECGNTAVFTQIVSVVDNTDPVLSVNPDATVECGSEFDLAGATATDNCGEATVESDSSFVADCGNSGVWTITYTATDECGNTAVGVQTITIVDNTAPEFEYAPENDTVECDSVPTPEEAYAYDNCGEASVTMNESSAGACPQIITRTYTATDDCGNTAVHVQTLTVVDTTAPVITCLPDLIADCDDNTSVGAIGGATATDACGDVAITWVNDVEELCGLSKIIYRHFTATDDCGNTATCTQIITKLDNDAPVFDATTVPADATVQCDAIPAPASPEATDNCGDASVSLLETETPGDCDGEKTILRTWTAIDDCDNTATVSQTILVIDTTAPEFDSEVEDETYTCGDEIPAAPVLNADDNCAESVSVVFEEVTEGNTNPNLDCTLTTGEPSAALNDDTVWSMFLSQTGSAETDYYILDENGASFVEIPLGGGEFEGHLTGTLIHADNGLEAFMMDVYLIQKTDYDGWTGQLTLGNPSVPRQSKDFNGVANPGDELDWDYWVLDGSRSQLIGIDDYAGDIIALEHAPSNLLFGFEVGMNANNYSEGFGIGGWFTYSGTIAGEEVAGQGDFAFSADCPPCEYTITRTWTATDDCGNSTVTTQLITVNAPEELQSEDEQVIMLSSDQYGFLSTYPNPTGTSATLVYAVPVDTEVRIEVLDENGKAMNAVYNGMAEANIQQQAKFDGTNLNNGLYIVKMTTDVGVFYTKVMILK